MILESVTLNELRDCLVGSETVAKNSMSQLGVVIDGGSKHVAWHGMVSSSVFLPMKKYY